MKKIGIITPFVNNYGGGEVFINNLVNYCNNYERDIEMVVYTPDPGVFQCKTSKIPDISNYRKFFKNFYKTIRIIKMDKVDVVILNDHYLGQFSLFFFFCFKRVLSLVHGDISFNKIKNIYLSNIITKIRLLLILIGSKLVLSVNLTNLKLYKYNPRVKYIGNFVSRLPHIVQSNKQYTFIYAGRLVEIKNIDLIIECFAEYKKTIDSNATLLIVGEGEMQSRVLEKINELCLGNSVKMVGKVEHDDMYKWYQKSRCLLLFSITEGFPTVVLEALQNGIPCLVSDVGSNSSIIIDNENGYVFNLDDNKDKIVDLMKKCMLLKSQTCICSVENYYIDNFYKRFREFIK